jgi:hypothetical protein
VRPSVDQRRAAIADALRAVNAEAAANEETPAVIARLDGLSAALSQVIERLDAVQSCVETAVLESVWEREPGPFPADHDEDSESDTDATVVSVPAVPLGEGRMSSVASRALFGH